MTEEFKENLQNLLKLGLRIKDQGSTIFKKSTPTWSIWINKIYLAFMQAGKHQAFSDMFYRFWFKYQENLSSELIDEDGNIQDNWLKVKDTLFYPGDKPGDKKKKISLDDTWGKKDLRCFGIVIFFDDTNSKLNGVSIPITELYLSAIKWHKEKRDEENDARMAPALVLKYLYNCIYYSIPDETVRSVLKRNIELINELVADMAPPEGTEDAPSGALGGVGEVLKKIMKSTGISDGSFDSKSIGKAVSGLFNEGMSEKIGKMMNHVMEGVDKEKLKSGEGIGDVIENIGSSFQKQEFKDLMSETGSEVMKIVKETGLMPDKPVDTGAESKEDPGEQE